MLSSLWAQSTKQYLLYVTVSGTLYFYDGYEMYNQWGEFVSGTVIICIEH